MATVLDDDYPTSPRFIHNLPPFLFYRGVLNPHLAARSIAFVDTRDTTDDGLNSACRWRSRVSGRRRTGPTTVELLTAMAF